LREAIGIRQAGTTDTPSASSSELYLDHLTKPEKRNAEGQTHVRGEAVAPSAAARTINLLSSEIDDLESTARDALDEVAQKLWDEIVAEMRQQQFHSAVEGGKRLEEWLTKNEARISDTARGRSYLLLARLELIRVVDSAPNPHETTGADRLFARAREAFGNPDRENQARLTSFEATLLAFKGDPRGALEVLGSEKDSALISTRLLILIELDELERAAEHAREVPVDDKCCEQATLVFAGTGATEEASFPEFHNTYMDPDSFAHVEKTGEYRDGTVIVKELLSVGSKEQTSGKGYFQGDFIGLEVSVKDSKRFPKEPGNWAYFSFGHKYPLKADVVKSGVTSCNSCHEKNATNFVFSEVFPVLKDALKKASK